MFGSLKRAALGAAITADTQKTIRALRELSLEFRVLVASDLYLNIRQANYDLSAAQLGDQLSEVACAQVVKAQMLRKRALAAGAIDHSHPAWAAAALFESWAVAMSGQISEKHSSAIFEMILSSFLSRTLSDSQTAELDQRFSQTP